MGNPDQNVYVYAVCFSLILAVHQDLFPQKTAISWTSCGLLGPCLFLFFFLGYYALVYAIVLWQMFCLFLCSGGPFILFLWFSSFPSVLSIASGSLQFVSVFCLLVCCCTVVFFWPVCFIVGLGVAMVSQLGFGKVVWGRVCCFLCSLSAWVLALCVCSCLVDWVCMQLTLACLCQFFGGWLSAFVCFYCGSSLGNAGKLFDKFVDPSFPVSAFLSENRVPIFRLLGRNGASLFLRLWPKNRVLP